MARSHPRSETAKHRLSGDGGLTVMKSRCSSEETEGGQIMETSCLPMIRLTLNTDGCRVVSGMCQEAWIDFDISEITFMVHFYR